METAREEDPELSAIRELFGQLPDHFGDREWTTAELIKIACEREGQIVPGFKLPDFNYIRIVTAEEATRDISHERWQSAIDAALVPLAAGETIDVRFGRVARAHPVAAIVKKLAGKEGVEVLARGFLVLRMLREQGLDLAPGLVIDDRVVKAVVHSTLVGQPPDVNRVRQDLVEMPPADEPAAVGLARRGRRSTAASW